MRMPHLLRHISVPLRHTHATAPRHSSTTRSCNPASLPWKLETGGVSAGLPSSSNLPFCAVLLRLLSARQTASCTSCNLPGCPSSPAVAADWPSSPLSACLRRLLSLSGSAIDLTGFLWTVCFYFYLGLLAALQRQRERKKKKRKEENRRKKRRKGPPYEQSPKPAPTARPPVKRAATDSVKTHRFSSVVRCSYCPLIPGCR